MTYSVHDSAILAVMNDGNLIPSLRCDEWELTREICEHEEPVYRRPCTRCGSEVFVVELFDRPHLLPVCHPRCKE